MQHQEVSGAVRPLKWWLGVKWLTEYNIYSTLTGQIYYKIRGLESLRNYVPKYII